ncbi:MAG: hypothetical protein WBG41_01695 [Acidimicrobiales bacterium]
MLRRVVAASAVLPLLAVAWLLGVASPAAAAGASAATSMGTLTGNVVVIGAPAGFSGEVGVAACPASASKGLCSSPQFAVSGSGGSYTLSLAAGAWEVREFYSVGFNGGAFIGRPRTISLIGGQTVRQNFAIHYQTPSSITGTATVTDVPPGVTVEQLSVIACPSYSPVVAGTPSPLCATDFLSLGSSEYSIPTLSKGAWLLYVGYYTEFGLTTVQVPGEVKLHKGSSVTDNLAVAYQTPTNALVEGTVTITGAPSGFSALAGVGGCPTSGAPSKGSGGGATACSSPEYTFAGSGGAYQLVLPQGPWELAGFYELAPFGGQFLSAIQSTTLTGGSIVTLNFTIPYIAPATVSGTIKVKDVPVGTVIQETILLACPTIAPYTGTIVPIECVDSFASPNEAVTIATLPPGKWLLYPGYETATAETISTIPKRVTLTSGETTAKKLSIIYAFG